MKKDGFYLLIALIIKKKEINKIWILVTFKMLGLIKLKILKKVKILNRKKLLILIRLWNVSVLLMRKIGGKSGGG